MPCFTYKSRRTDALPFSDDEMTPCHIILSPTRVGGKFTQPEIVPRESSSAGIAAKTTRVSLILFYNIRHDFYVKSSAIGQSGTILTFIQWKPCPKVTKTSGTYVCRRTMSACLLTERKRCQSLGSRAFQSGGPDSDSDRGLALR